MLSIYDNYLTEEQIQINNQNIELINSINRHLDEIRTTQEMNDYYWSEEFQRFMDLRKEFICTRDADFYEVQELAESTYKKFCDLGL